LNAQHSRPQSRVSGAEVAKQRAKGTVKRKFHPCNKDTGYSIGKTLGSGFGPSQKPNQSGPQGEAFGSAKR